MHDTQKNYVFAQLRSLESLNLAGLRAKWCELCNSKPPVKSVPTYLLKRLRYRIQALAYGGDSEETNARLDENVRRHCIGKHNYVVMPKAGTILTRIYRGQEYQVLVLADGFFQYNDCKYKSLSAVAKLITGVSWNGWEFWRLKDRSGEHVE
jgi:hypothetical protein